MKTYTEPARRRDGAAGQSRHPLTVSPIALDALIEPRYLVAIIAEKGKPRENVGRKVNGSSSDRPRDG